MQQSTQVRLLGELLGLHARQQPFLDDATASSPVTDYTDTQRFEQEQARIFRAVPRIVAHRTALGAVSARGPPC